MSFKDTFMRGMTIYGAGSMATANPKIAYETIKSIMDEQNEETTR